MGIRWEIPAEGWVQVRASRAERDAVIARLQNAFAGERITREELEERTAAAITAVTRADLVPLTADLPPEPAAFPPDDGRSAVAAGIRRGALSRLEQPVTRRRNLMLALVLALVMIAAALSGLIITGVH